MPLQPIPCVDTIALTCIHHGKKLKVAPVAYSKSARSDQHFHTHTPHAHTHARTHTQVLELRTTQKTHSIEIAEISPFINPVPAERK